MVQAVPEKKQIYQFQIATIYENLKNIDQALDVYNKILETNPNHLDSCRALQRLYKEQKKAKLYVGIVKKLLDLVAGIQDKIELRLALAIFYQKKQPENMEKHLLEILQLQPNHQDALCRLKELYLQNERWSDVAQICIHEVQFLCLDGNSLFQKYLEIAKLYQNKIEDVEKSVEYYEKSLILQPKNLEILETLEKLYEESKNFENL